MRTLPCSLPALVTVALSHFPTTAVDLYISHILNGKMNGLA